jgi:hypothetical protein
LAKWNASAEPSSLLSGFEIVEKPTDVGEEEVADLGLLVERGLDLGKGIFQVPMLVGKGKRGPNLFEARRVLPSPRKEYAFQDGRKRKTPRMETSGIRPREERAPGALIGR